MVNFLELFFSLAVFLNGLLLQILEVGICLLVLIDKLLLQKGYLE